MKTTSTNKWYFPWEKKHGVAVNAENIEVKDEMTTKELINALQYHIDNADMPLSDEDAKDIIKRLKELEVLECRLHGIKMCVEGEVKIKE